MSNYDYLTKQILCKECDSVVDGHHGGFDVCTNCGYCVPESCELAMDVDYHCIVGANDWVKDQEKGTPNRVQSINPKYKSLVKLLERTLAEKPTYNPLYYANEKRGLFDLTCPEIPYFAWIAIKDEYTEHPEKYPADTSLLSKIHAVQMCRSSSYLDTPVRMSCSCYKKYWAEILLTMGAYNNPDYNLWKEQCGIVRHVPDDAMRAIQQNYRKNDDKFGPKFNLTKKDAMELCKIIFIPNIPVERSCRIYSEKWKSILARLGAPVNIPPKSLTDFMYGMDMVTQEVIQDLLPEMPETRRKNNSKNSGVVKTARKASPSLDYKMRYFAWLWNGQNETIYDHEFPYLKTPRKREALDVLFAKMAERMNLPFKPSYERDNPPTE